MGFPAIHSWGGLSFLTLLPFPVIHDWCGSTPFTHLCWVRLLLWYGNSNGISNGVRNGNSVSNGNSDSRKIAVGDYCGSCENYTPYFSYIIIYIYICINDCTPFPLTGLLCTNWTPLFLVTHVWGWLFFSPVSRMHVTHMLLADRMLTFHA